MDDLLGRYVAELTGRIGGPLGFRLLIQPLVAAGIGVRAGLRDAHADAPAYGQTLATQPERRKELIHEGWKDVGRVLLIAVGVDMVYELLVFGGLRFGQATIVGFILVVPVYLLTRGFTNRILRALRHHNVSTKRRGPEPPD